jgi:hypothetical protein
LRERVGDPRRRDLTARLAVEPERLTVPIDAALDQLVGPIYYRALIADAPVDDALVDSIVRSLVAVAPDRTPD